jgi:hypothetical protein
MRKHLGGPTVALTVSVFVALMLVVGFPQRADAAVVYYGVSESSASWAEGSNTFTFHWRFSVAKDTSTGQIRYRAHLWCTKNGSNSPCNFRNDDAWLFYKDCAPSNFSLACERTINGYGPRDFPGCPTYCNVSNAYYDGTWHSDAHVSYRSVSYTLQARFLGSVSDHLTQVYAGCSNWADPQTGAWYYPGTCPASH